MNIERLRKELEIDEGVEYKIYEDHLGLPTCGIGHLILKTDPEYGQPINTPVSEERVNELFEKDIAVVIKDCETVFGDHWEELPEEAQLIIANMLFNMGLTRFLKFLKFIAAIKAYDYLEAAKQMVDSRWYKQVGKRSVRLVERMRSLDTGSL